MHTDSMDQNGGDTDTHMHTHIIITIIHTTIGNLIISLYRSILQTCKCLQHIVYIIIQIYLNTKEGYKEQCTTTSVSPLHKTVTHIGLQDIDYRHNTKYVYDYLKVII